MIEFVRRWLRWQWIRPQPGAYWRGFTWDEMAFRRALIAWRSQRPRRQRRRSVEPPVMGPRLRALCGNQADSVGSEGNLGG